jgi:hypothetical protein
MDRGNRIAGRQRAGLLTLATSNDRMPNVGYTSVEACMCNVFPESVVRSLTRPFTFFSLDTAIDDRHLF